MASCPDCGATVTFEECEGRGRIALDTVPTMSGPFRYRVKNFQTRLHEKVGSATYETAYAAHEYTCPARQRERERF